MANGNFVVQNGLQVGALTIFAGNGDIVTTGNLTSAAASATFDSINATPIGNATPSTGAFTTLTGTVVTASTQFTGPGTGLTGTASSLSVNYASTAGTVTTASQPNVTSVGTLTGLNLSGATTSSSTISATAFYAPTIGNSGATITGTLSTASQPNITTLAGVTSIGASGSTTLTGTLQTAAQPNVTSVGTLSGLAVSGTTNTGTLIASTVNAATIGNTGATQIGSNISSPTQLTSTGSTSNYGTLNIGGAINYGPDYGLVGSFVANIPNYAYVAVQNLNTGGNASASFTAYNNTGTSFIDVGVNSSNFNAVASGFVNNALNTASASYAYSQGGEMVIGTWNNNGIHFITNAVTTAGDSMFISGNGNVYISGNLTVSGNTTQINTITNFTTESANVIQTAYLQGNVSTNGGNITVQNNILPGTSSLYSLGSTSYPFVNIYATTHYGSGAGLTNIPNSALTNSSVTVTAGTGLSGGGAVSLGGSVTLNNAGVTSAVAGTGITLSGGTGAVTITNSGVTSVVAGTDISISGATGAVTVNDTSTLATVTGRGASTSTAVTFSGGATFGGTVVPNANASVNLGSSGAWWATIYGTSTHAQYADLAENYQGDRFYNPGTVVMFGGTEEVTQAEADTTRVAGVVSTNPAHLMNGGLTGSNVVPLALQGRVPCQVIGPVAKGDLMVSAGFGYAKTNNAPAVGQVIGKALQDFPIAGKGVIEVVVGRF